jgi:hypothetical protein
MEHGKLHTGEEIDPQDMRFMGGLRKKMPATFWTFVAGAWRFQDFLSSPPASGRRMRSFPVLLTAAI